MSKNASALKVKLSSYDELFGANAPVTSDKNQIVNVSLSELEYHGDRFGGSLIGYVGLITVTMAYN